MPSATKEQQKQRAAVRHRATFGTKTAYVNHLENECPYRTRVAAAAVQAAVEATAKSADKRKPG